MIPSRDAIQTAIYDRLAGSPPTDIDSAAMGIYDEVPQTNPDESLSDTTFPFCTMGDIASDTWDDKTADGRNATVTIRIWSRYQGRKEANLAIDHVNGLFDNHNLSVTGSHTTLMHHVFDDVIQDTDGRTYQGLTRFRLLIHEV